MCVTTRTTPLRSSTRVLHEFDLLQILSVPGTRTQVLYLVQFLLFGPSDRVLHAEGVPSSSKVLRITYGYTGTVLGPQPIISTSTVL